MRSSGLAIAGLILASCATTSRDETSSSMEAELQRGAAIPLSAPVQLVPSRLPADEALDRARSNVEANGFEVPLAPRRTPAGGASTSVALASLLPESDVCRGTTEIIQLGAFDRGPGSMVAFTCFTEAWSDPVKAGEPCRHREVAGCPNKGDRVLAGVAVEAASTL